MSDTTFDAIVLGVGGMGSAAAFELARRGRRVLALEQFALGHDRGSSHGHTRIIRKAYYEHPNYVPLVLRLGPLARPGTAPRPNAADGTPLLERRPARRRADRRRCASRRSNTACRSKRSTRSPCAAAIPPSVSLTITSASSNTRRDSCTSMSASRLRRGGAKLGAVVRENEPVISWKAEGGGVAVETTAGRYTAGRLVVTAGPWAGRMLGEIGAGLTVMRQVVFWLGGGLSFQRDVFPIFIADTDDGAFYGLPALNADGLKVARHYGAPERREPSEIVRTVSEEDEAPVRRFVCAHLPAADGPVRRAATCIYTLTADRHFLIDVHPEHPQVVFAAGFSGHGFKFASVVGEILADLAESGRTDQPIEMFRLARLRSK